MQMRESARNLKNVLICGKGEIGAALGFIAEQRGFTVDYHDPAKGFHIAEKHFYPEIVHICYPVKTPELPWIYFIKTKVVIIDATIPIGLASQIQAKIPDILVLHSPVRGRHPWMVGGLHKYVKFVGPADPTRLKETEDFCQFYYTQLGIPYKVLSSADNAAAGKLWDTTYYLTEIMFANQVAVYCAKKGLNFNEVYNQFQETADIGRRFENIKGRAICKEFVPRPVMVPGFVGGHCLMPNLEILKNDISPALYSWIKQIQEYFATDIKTVVESKGTETSNYEDKG